MTLLSEQQAKMADAFQVVLKNQKKKKQGGFVERRFDFKAIRDVVR